MGDRASAAPPEHGGATAYALGAIALWSTLASLGVLLRHVPPFLLTGVALAVGSAPTWPLVARSPKLWAVPWTTLALGVCGLFGYHFLLFMALRFAPPVEANLVNYLWPLLLVVLAPVFQRGVRLHAAHLLAAALGFAGAAVAIVGGGGATGRWSWAHLLALGAAVLWACYSLLTRRVAPFATAAVGLFGLVSGALSLLCHAALEPRVTLTPRDVALLAVTGVGPLGAAFLLWDRALKRGDPRHIGVLSYLTPLASTTLLLVVSGRPLTAHVAAAGAMIVGAAALGTRAR